MKNKDKKLCKTCVYRTRVGVFIKENMIKDKNPNIACDYIGVTGHSRMLICSAEDCTVYKKGPAIPAKEATLFTARWSDYRDSQKILNRHQ